MSKVAVTGAGGYIGTQIVRDLLTNNHDVLAIDRFFFGIDALNEFKENKKLSILKKDIRDINENDLKNYDIVFDLACLSNDPSGELNPNLTYSINRDGRIHMAKTAKKAGIKRYIISSSCSVYGTGDDNFLNEESKTNPISVYAQSTLDAESTNLSLADANFSVTSLRNATVFGKSNRMRFDLVVNLMTLTAFQNGRIIVMGGGNQWRPLVHISDVSKAFISTIIADVDKVNHQIFNIGYKNVQIKNLAYLVREELPIKIEIEVAPDDNDKRDYNVDFSKASTLLNFQAQTTIAQGVKEIYNALKMGTIDTSLRTNTVSWYKNIISSKDLIDSIELNGRLI